MTPRTRALFTDAWPLVAAALALSGCTAAAPLVELRAVEAGDVCPQGGTEVLAGVDEDGDGSLSSDEVTSSEVVCNGVPGDQGDPGTLTRTTVLEVGDPNCPSGGLRLDFGPDDGSGGGTANDGVLQDGEVTRTEFVCNGEAAFSGTPYEPPPAGGPTFTLDASGGDGTQGSGGDGGSYEAVFDYGTIGGGVKVFATGQAVSPLAVPTTFTAFLGQAPAVVATDTAVPLDPVLDDLADGALYLLSGDAHLYLWNDTDGAGVAATGLRVEAGAKLTLPVNDLDGGQATLDLPADLHLLGTLTTTDGAGGKADLRLDVGNWIGEASGRVDLSGGDGDGAPGASVSVSCYSDHGDVQRYGGLAINAALFDTTGGDGPSGGDGGDVDFEVGTVAYNTGPIFAGGGDGSSVSGGRGGDFDFTVEYGIVMNAALVDLDGGKGITAGGDGGQATLYNQVGWVVNTGNIQADGGSTADCPSETTCTGGNGGRFYVQVYSCAVVNTGDFSARGGDAPQATLSDNYAPAGRGGTFEVDFGGTENGWYGDDNRVGDVHVSGNIDVRGGTGGWGGDGGSVEVGYSARGVPDNQEVVFFGYPVIDVSAGDGGGDGGEAGSFYLEAGSAQGGVLYDDGPGGYVANYADVDMHGGTAGANYGGDGGDFEMYTDDSYSSTVEWAVAINHGDVDATGGLGGDTFGKGGEGGYVFLFGAAGVTNSGDLDTSGAAATAEGYRGGNSGEQHLLSDQGLVDNDGALTNNAGDSPSADGGYARTIEIVGAEVANSGDLLANGGDGGAAANDGGAGGFLFLHSLWGTTTQSATTLEVDGGAGSTPGPHGQVFIDGQNVTESWVD